MSNYGMSGRDDRTQRFDPEPTVVAGEEHTVRLYPRDDSAGYTVPEARTQAAEIPTQPFTPGGLPQRVPAQFDPAAGQPSAQSGGRTQDPPVTSLRIGKGVVAAKAGRARDGRPFWGSLTRVLSGILTVVLIAGVAWTGWQWWQHFHNAVEVTNVAVAPAQLFDHQCNVQYDVVGTLNTNGKAGTISYEWIRSDGQKSGALKQSVAAGQKSTTVHLYWKFTGEGSMLVTATLRVLKPALLDGFAQFLYDCG